MQITDPVADMLTRIRNANSAKHETVDVPASNLKKAIAQILLEEGYIKSFNLVDNGNQGVIHITLKYLAKKQPALSGLKRVSKPGLRIYAGADEMPHVLKGHYFPFNLFLREFFSRNVFILCMIRTIHTAVHTIIRQIQWSKHYNSIAVKILFNLFRQCTDFLILLLILTDQKNRCLPVVQTFSFSCFVFTTLSNCLI